MEYTLGVDIGTGSVKAVAVDMQCRSFEVTQQFYGFSAPKPCYHEQDPNAIWQAFKTVISAIIDKVGKPPVAVSLSSAMHSLIPVDAQCKPLHPMITWADNRSSSIAESLCATEDGMTIYAATGTPLHAMSPLCKIIWMRKNNPELFSWTFKFISIKEFIWYQLFGVFEVDESNASCSGLYDIVKREWYAPALEIAGITNAQLSKVVPTDHKRTFEYASVIPGLSSAVFFIGASDGCLANLGSMADKPGIAALTIGTSGAVRIASRKQLPNPQAMTFSYILDQQTYICGGPINNGGIAMQWWLNNISSTEGYDYDRLFADISTIKPGSEGLIFLPYLTGDRAPIWDSEACGNFFGVKLQHSQAHFSRAVMEGICYALKDVLEAVQQNAEPITQINISGGFTRSTIWVQALADILNKKSIIAQSDDASAVGAAFIAIKDLKKLDDYPGVAGDDLKEFEPDADNVVVYEKGFRVYRELYQALKPVMHLNPI